MLHAIPRRRRSTLALALVAALVAACDSDSPTAPSPTPTPPAPSTITINGYVGDQTTGAGIGGATVRASSGQTTSTQGDGYYELSGLTTGTVTITASAGGYNSRSQSVTATSTQRVDLELAPFFRRSGTGAQVFDMPSGVSRVRIAGSYSGFCENFIVRIGGRLVVNEILGTCSVASGGARHEGTYAVSGTVVEVLSSVGINWEIEQIQ